MFCPQTTEYPGRKANLYIHKKRINRAAKFSIEAS